MHCTLHDRTKYKDFDFVFLVDNIISDYRYGLKLRGILTTRKITEFRSKHKENTIYQCQCLGQEHVLTVKANGKQIKKPRLSNSATGLSACRVKMNMMRCQFRWN